MLRAILRFFVMMPDNETKTVNTARANDIQALQTAVHWVLRQYADDKNHYTSMVTKLYAALSIKFLFWQ